MLAYRHSIGSSLSHAGTCAKARKPRWPSACPKLSACDWIPDRIVFARRNGPRRADRILLVGFEELDTTKAEAKVYQIVMLVLLSLVPALTIVDFWEVAAGLTNCSSDD